MDAGPQLLDGLDDAQRRAVTAVASPLCILAGAGSGKTRVLTRRIAWRCHTGEADPRHVLALTFTRKAAGELKSRLRQLGLRDDVAAGTFHALAYATLRARWAETGTSPPTLVESKLRLVARVMPRTKGREVKAADFAGEIEWAKARMITADRYAAEAVAAGRRPPVDAPEMGRTFARYEEAKRNARLVDFDDLLGLCARAIETDAEFAAAQRWRFRHLFVDEFQDVNPLQFRVLEAWRGPSLDLCVVGDPNQAIYAWNGADAGYLTAFRDRFPTADVVTLDHNYRSSPQVVAVANAVLAAGGEPFRLRPTQGVGPIPLIRAYATDLHEARAIARTAHDLHGPSVPWSHQAVLVRTHAQSVVLERAFSAAHIPFRVKDRAAFLDLAEVKDALRELGKARSLADGLAALDAATGLTGDDDLEAPDGDIDLAAAPAPLSDAELTRLHNLEELLRLGAEYRTLDTDPTAAGFGAWLTATLTREDGQGGGDRIDIATFHAAKGLEWPVVHLAGLEAGLVPIGLARTAAAAAEERRLFYVAVTRAERRLRCSWAEQRMFGTRTSNRSRSPFLDEVDHVLAALAAGESVDDWRPHVAAQRERVRGSARARDEISPDDKALFDALKQWRAAAARAANVPAFVIFHDSTLEALARSRPATPAALLAVPGIGKVKATRFGADVLALVAAEA